MAFRTAGSVVCSSVPYRQFRRGGERRYREVVLAPGDGLEGIALGNRREALLVLDRESKPLSEEARMLVRIPERLIGAGFTHIVLPVPAVPMNQLLAARVNEGDLSALDELSLRMLRPLFEVGLKVSLGYPASSAPVPLWEFGNATTRQLMLEQHQVADRIRHIMQDGGRAIALLPAVNLDIATVRFSGFQSAAQELIVEGRVPLICVRTADPARRPPALARAPQPWSNVALISEPVRMLP